MAPQLDEPVERGVLFLQEAMAPDRDGRSGRHAHHRRQAVATGQLHVQLGAAGVEPSLARAQMESGVAHQLDELVVAVDHRVHALLHAADPLDPDVVGAVDVDVLDGRVVQQRLQLSEAEEGVEDGLGERLLLLLAEGGAQGNAGAEALLGVAVELVVDQLFGPAALVGEGQRDTPAVLVDLALVGQPEGHGLAEPSHELPARGAIAVV